MGNLQRILFLIAACICTVKLQELPQKPNIVFMIADDLGWSDVSFHGSKQIPTPNIDALARDGIILNKYYVQSICSPSRGSLMTGKYPMRFGFQHEVIQAPMAWGLPLSERIIPEYLKTLDYSTHAIGKWHLGFFQEDYLPTNRGFDSHFGYYTGVGDYFTHYSVAGNYSGLDLHCNLENVWTYNGTYSTELYTTKAKEIIEEHDSSKPLFLYFAQQAPHSGNFDVAPIQVPDKYVEPLIGIDNKKRRKFAGMVQALDQAVGEVIDALDKSGMLENTLFIFTTDNGGVIEEQDGGIPGSNFPLRGTKYNLWEGGTRGISFVWAPFLRRQSRIYNEMMHISDWLPTLLSAAGGPKSLEMLEDIDGVDHWPSLVQKLPSPRMEILLNLDDQTGIKALRNSRFKYVNGSYDLGKYDGWYDLEGDPIENGVVPSVSPSKRLVYYLTYLRLLRQAKAARILWRKYRRHPLLAVSCRSRRCREQLEIQCNKQRPTVDTCKPENHPCLFDIVNDPCEFNNIAEQFPEVTAAMEESIDKYEPLMLASVHHALDPGANPALHGGVWGPWL